MNIRAMKRSRWFLTLLFLLTTLLPSLINSSSQNRSAVFAQEPAYEPRFEPDFCPVRLTFDFPLRCGYLIVPEDRTNPNGKQIRLAVVIVASRSENPEPDSILLVQGSLGMDAIGAGLPLVDRFYKHWLNNRDIIILDQRGSGFSEPNLNCPEIELLYFERLGLHLAPEDDDALANAAIQRCYDRLNVDTRFYNAEESVLDMRDLRQALDIEEWNIFAISFATRTVLSLVRDYPEGIRSVIVDNPLPPDTLPTIEGLTPTINGIHKFIEACANHPECAETYPDLQGMMSELVNKLNADPVVVPVWHPLKEETTEYYLDGNTALVQLSGLIGATGLTGRVPQLIDQMLHDDYVEFVRLISQNLTVNLLFAEGALISSECQAEKAIPVDAEPRLVAEELPEELTSALQARQISQFTASTCETWPSNEANTNYYDPVISDVPVLSLSGGFDMYIPSELSQRSFENLENGIFIEIPGLAGTMKQDCPIAIATQFLDTPTGELDTDCLDSIPVFDFVAPTE